MSSRVIETNTTISCNISGQALKTQQKLVDFEILLFLTPNKIMDGLYPGMYINKIKAIAKNK